MNVLYDFASAPDNEDCVQVSAKAEYMPDMQKEAERMLGICQKLWPSLDWNIQENPHDFGSYLTLRCHYNDDNEDQAKAFYDAERHWPNTWEEAEERVEELIKVPHSCATCPDGVDGSPGVACTGGCP